MKKLLLRIWQRLNRPLSTPEIMETYAYKAGFKAWQDIDRFNPYQPGTASHEHWQLGYEDAEHSAATLW
ncbi:hypothetical protein G3N96_04010 [Burkholderia sp. Se-20373]|uniref:hypothetical protein n=1 Tax=Burkholderia sp. Se-20373 TaxID=2703898 RepID=UPI0019801556|nr:hypothetical protein [Burkholderia sp. Se-20373]MBN3744600.1 hypothetical protein [Burkholderia sp. Se-20373]